MATFQADPTNPDFVYGPQGQLVERAALGPADVVLGAQPAPAAAPAPAAPAPASALNASSVLQKLDQVPRSGGSQLPVSGVSTTTQQGVAPSVLQPALQRIGESAERQAGAVEQAGEAKAQRGEQQAMTRTAGAYGQYSQATGDQAQAHQRAEIARKNELALSLEKDPEIDPDRFVRGMSTGDTIATIVLAAFNGAFKGATGQGGNDVIDMLNARIDQDIAAQKEQIQSGRIRRGNLISYFQQQGLHEEEAKKAARATSWTMLDRMTEAEAARVGAGDARTDATLLAEQIRGQAVAKKEELTLALGTDRSTTTVQREAPKAGAGAGMESFTKQLAARKAYEEAGASPEQLSAFDKAMGIPSPGGESETARHRRQDASKAGELSEAQGKSQAAAEAIEALGTAAGLSRDPNTGKWTGGSDVYREGSFWDSDGAYKSRFDAAVEAYGRMQSGGVIGGEEREAFQDMLSARRASVLANKLNAAEVTIQSRQKSERVGGAPAPEAWK